MLKTMSVSAPKALLKSNPAHATAQAVPAASITAVQTPDDAAVANTSMSDAKGCTTESLSDEEFPVEEESSRPYIAVPLAPPKPMIRCNTQTPLQWLRQTYQQQWKGSIDIRTVEAEDHAPRNPHWCCFMTVSGAVVKDHEGRNVTLDPLEVDTEGRTKKEAEQAAADKIKAMLIDQGWYDPSKTGVSKKGRVGRANKFMVDNVMSNEANALAYLDVSIDGEEVGRVVIELFRYKKGTTLDDHAPLAVENFLALCRGVEIRGQQYSYKGVPFTRIVPRFLLQAGDVVNKDGTGGTHIHQSHGQHFPDEGLDDRNYRHNRPFMVSVANLGIENSNSSQFFITVSPTVELDGRHTCFGKVLAGYGVIKQIESLGESSELDQPVHSVIISDCGELPSAFDYRSTPNLMAAGWPVWSEDQGPPPEGVREVQFRLDIATALKEAGNEAYFKGDDSTAVARYHQAVRYLNWTTFKIRTLSGEVDMEAHESAALWDMEVLLMGNIAAAQLRLKQYRAAADTCDEILRRNPFHVKALLRSAQAHINMGWAEYDSAEGYLNRAERQATEQQLPTQVKEVAALRRRLQVCRKQHQQRLKSKFSAAFAQGLLHHPADDEPSAASKAADGTVSSYPDSFQQVPRDRLCSLGAVSRERVLESRQPVFVDDVWGTHVLVADGGTNSEHSADSQQQTGSGVYDDSGLKAMMAQMQMSSDLPVYGSGAESYDGSDNSPPCAADDDGQCAVFEVDRSGLDAPTAELLKAQAPSCSMQPAIPADRLMQTGGSGDQQPQQGIPQTQQQQQQHSATAAPEGVLTEDKDRHAAAQGESAGSVAYGAGALQALPRHGVGSKTKVVVP